MGALGSKDRAQFKVGGHFNNDKGLVETGNDRFALDSSSLYNPQGTAREFGTQGFDLSLADSHNGKIFLHSASCGIYFWSQLHPIPDMLLLRVR